MTNEERRKEALQLKKLGARIQFAKKQGKNPIDADSGSALSDWGDAPEPDINKLNGQNVGIVNGPASGDLVTLDLDTAEARIVMAEMVRQGFVPPSPTWGRVTKKGKPPQLGHYLSVPNIHAAFGR